MYKYKKSHSTPNEEVEKLKEELKRAYPLEENEGYVLRKRCSQAFDMVEEKKVEIEKLKDEVKLEKEKTTTSDDKIAGLKAEVQNLTAIDLNWQSTFASMELEYKELQTESSQFDKERASSMKKIKELESQITLLTQGTASASSQIIQQLFAKEEETKQAHAEELRKQRKAQTQALFQGSQREEALKFQIDALTKQLEEGGGKVVEKEKIVYTSNPNMATSNEPAGGGGGKYNGPITDAVIKQSDLWLNMMEEKSSLEGEVKGLSTMLDVEKAKCVRLTAQGKAHELHIQNMLEEHEFALDQSKRDAEESSDLAVLNTKDGAFQRLEAERAARKTLQDKSLDKQKKLRDQIKNLSEDLEDVKQRLVISEKNQARMTDQAASQLDLVQSMTTGSGNKQVIILHENIASLQQQLQMAEHLKDKMEEEKNKEVQQPRTNHVGKKYDKAKQ